MTSITSSKIRYQQISDLLANGKRLDSRTAIEYRPIEVKSGIIEKAEGSAKVCIGKTEVMVGVKIGIGKPFTDRPNDGVLSTNTELVPLASPEFEAGPPKENAIEIARVVDRGIRESKAIDLEKLCIVPGKKVFIVYIDIYVLNHDGNMIDASALASLAALMNTKIFKYEIKKDEVEIKPGFSELPINNYPIAVTIAYINGKRIVDPWLDEEEVLDSRLTITFEKENNICAIQKGGIGTLTPIEIKEAVNLASTKAEELRKILVKD